MILVLAEKPSAMRNFAKALGGEEGSYNGEDYKICALRGHVRGLKMPEDQVPADLHDDFTKWDLDKLPWDLTLFAWGKGTLPGCKEILHNLHDALGGVNEVAIATDDDPSGEGEVLAWEALEYCRWRGKTSRMFFPDEAPKSVQKAFCERKTISSMEEDGDYVKGHLRERWDLASMQFTRAATSVARNSRFYTVVRQGRLKSVMVKLVGDQRMAYESYVKKPFYEARFKDANDNVFARKVEDVEEIRFDSKDKVNLSGLHESSITEDSRTQKHTAPGKLLDLAALSAILAKQGFKPEAVLATYQKMYEAQVVSYPRTEDKQITPEQFAELLPLADKIAKVIGVKPELLTHKEPRKSHVKEGGAHGANRPGPNVPSSLDDLKQYGKEAQAIYEILARNYLAILCEDYEFELVKGHVTDFPEYVGETRVPIPGKQGFKAVFDSEKQSEDDDDADEGANEFLDPAAPYVYEGANQRPQKPTMKWLNKKLEKFNVGTGATRTSTLAEVTKQDNGKELLAEHKGELNLTECGAVSYALIDGCQIADPKVTKQLFDQMAAVGRFELDPEAALAEVADMVQHDIEVMEGNAGKLSELGLGRKKGKVIGKCPRCHEGVLLTEKLITCSSNSFKANENGEWKLVGGCGFRTWRTVAGKKLTEKQASDLLEKGRTGLVKGLKSKKTGKTFEAKLVLDPKEGKIGFVFPERKSSKTGGNPFKKC